jgi:L-alanine-DL-glutamate epimerase-like enolase superfamily enzyme
MRITDVREQSVRLQAAIRNSVVDFSKMTVSVVAVHSDLRRDGRPLVGYGFDSIGRYAQSGLLRERFIPRLLKADPDSLLGDGGLVDPARVAATVMRDEKPGGHGERSAAVAAIELAVWDLVAKAEDKPLYRLLADRFREGRCEPHVEVYAAGGYYYPGEDVEGLREEMRRYLGQGYTHVKMKVGGASLADDCRRIEAVLELVPDGSHAAVDANGRFDLATAQSYAAALAPYGLRWYEEPGDPLDFELQARLCAEYDLPYATGENLFSHQDVRNLLRYAGLSPERDWLQMDPGLSYGISEYLRMIDAMEEFGWSRTRIIPHGGHLMALHIAAGLGLGRTESYPGVFQPFGGFGASAEVADGAVEPPEAPGAGLETKPELAAILAALA